MHRLPAYRFLPHDWLTFVLPWRSKHYARILLDEIKPDVVHIQSHIVIGRGLAREARKRGIPRHRDQPRDGREHPRLHHAPRLPRPHLRKLAWADAERTFKMTRAVTTPTRKAADFLESTIDISGVIRLVRHRPVELPPRPHPARRQPHPVRWPSDDREAHRRRAEGPLAARPPPRRHVRRRRRWRPARQTRDPRAAARCRLARDVPRPCVGRRPAHALLAGQRLRHRLDRGAAVDRDDGGHGIRSADRGGERGGAPAPRPRGRERLPLRAGQRRRARRAPDRRAHGRTRGAHAHAAGRRSTRSPCTTSTGRSTPSRRCTAVGRCRSNPCTS